MCHNESDLMFMRSAQGRQVVIYISMSRLSVITKRSNKILILNNIEILSFFGCLLQYQNNK